MFRDYNGNYAYTYVEIKNGAEVPGSASTSPFSLGGQNGLPLTKRELYCKWITPTRTTIISDKSTIVLAVSHTVTQPGGYFYTPPDRVTVNFNFDVNRLPGTCYDQTLTGSSKTSSCSVLRNGFILVSYPEHAGHNHQHSYLHMRYPKREEDVQSTVIFPPKTS